MTSETSSISNLGYNIRENFRNPLTQDPFNWNFPKKNTPNATMYLSTVRNEDVGFNIYKIKTRPSSTLHVGGIDGAKPKPILSVEINKVITTNKNDDIEKSHPKKLHQPLNKEHYELRVDDLGNQKKKKFITTRHPSNPNEPVYPLQTYEAIEPLKPKFIKDQLDLSDIEKAKPSKPLQTKFLRTTNFIEDIEGSKAKREYQRDFVLDQLNVNDISKGYKFKTNRNVNPLDPRYLISNENKNIYEYGAIEYSTSSRLHPVTVNRPVDFSLHPEDIDGAKANTKGNKIIYSKTRLNWRKSNNTEDVPGAQIGTLKKGISTNRCLNPNDPQYLLPGRTEATIHNITDFQKKNEIERCKSAAVNINAPLALKNGLNVEKSFVEPANQKQNSDAVEPKKPVVIQDSSKNVESKIEQKTNYFEKSEEKKSTKIKPDFDKSKNSFFGVDLKNEDKIKNYVPGYMKRDHVADEKMTLTQYTHEMNKNKISKSPEEIKDEQFRFSQFPISRPMSNAEKLNNYLKSMNSNEK